MKVEIFKVLNHRETKNVYIIDVKLYTKDENGHRHVLAEGKASANVKTSKGQCSVFGKDYTPSKEVIDQIVIVCVQRAKRLREEVFDKE